MTNKLDKKIIFDDQTNKLTEKYKIIYKGM